MSTSASFGSQNGTTSSNFLKRKLETLFLQHESKIEDILRFFPNYVVAIGPNMTPLSNQAYTNSNVSAPLKLSMLDRRSAPYPQGVKNMVGPPLKETGTTRAFRNTRSIARKRLIGQNRRSSKPCITKIRRNWHTTSKSGKL